MSGIVTGREEVIARAVKIAKEEYGIEVLNTEMQELYDITAKYIKDRLYEDPYLSVRLGAIGTAYYRIEYLRYKVRNTKKACKDGIKGSCISEKKYTEKLHTALYHIEDCRRRGRFIKNHRSLLEKIQVSKINKRLGYNILDIERIQNEY